MPNVCNAAGRTPAPSKPRLRAPGLTRTLHVHTRTDARKGCAGRTVLRAPCAAVVQKPTAELRQCQPTLMPRLKALTTQKTPLTRESKGRPLRLGLCVAIRTNSIVLKGTNFDPIIS